MLCIWQGWCTWVMFWLIPDLGLTSMLHVISSLANNAGSPVVIRRWFLSCPLDRVQNFCVAWGHCHNFAGNWITMSEDLTSVDLGLVPRDVPNDKHAGTTFNRFSSEDLTAKWLVGPVSQPRWFLKAQHLWSESRLWLLYDKFKVTEVERWPQLITFEVRLTSSWYFRSDYLDSWPEFLARRVRDEFCIKRRKSDKRMEQIFASFCQRCEWVQCLLYIFFLNLFGISGPLSLYCK